MPTNSSSGYLEKVYSYDAGDENAETHPGVKEVYDLIHNHEVLESPIDIHIPRTKSLILPELIWHHMELEPKKVKFTNSGHTVILSAKWHQERPYLSGGPFIGNYVFSQLHFHWGKNNMEGSEHTFSNVQYPLEMHAVYFRSCYLTQESALKKKDGICVLVYIFKLQEEVNQAISLLTNAILNIREPHQSFRMKTHPLQTFIKPFSNDYFLYVGSVVTSACEHYVLWMITREPMGISYQQVDIFRTLLDNKIEPLYRNYRIVQPHYDRVVYHVNPSGRLHSTLLIVEKETNKKAAQGPQSSNKYQRSSKEYSAATGALVYRATVIANPFIGREMIGDEKDEKKNKYDFSTKINVDPKVLEKLRECAFE